MKHLRLFAACLPGLEPWLRNEVAALGATPTVEAGGVAFEGDARLALRANLELGLASHVLARVATFPVERFEKLEGHVARLPWSGWFARGTPRRVRASCRRSRLYHSGAVEERVAQAIAVRLGDDLVTSDDPEAVPVRVRLADDVCTISVDLSGAPLHRRGYRLEPGTAPLREDVARALVLVSGWDYTGSLLDPMCGSGTILIEAALLARGMAPGRLRGFAAERTAVGDAALLAELRADCETRARPLTAPLFGADRDGVVLDAAWANLRRAGLGDRDVELRRQVLSAAVAETEWWGKIRAVVTNPPWGGRIGDHATLRNLYQALGKLFSALPAGARFAFTAADRQLAYATGVALTSAFLTEMGGTKLRAFCGVSGAAAAHVSNAARLR